MDSLIRSNIIDKSQFYLPFNLCSNGTACFFCPILAHWWFLGTTDIVASLLPNWGDCTVPYSEAEHEALWCNHVLIMWEKTMTATWTWNQWNQWNQCNASKLPTFRQVRKLFAPRGVSCCMLPESGHGLLLEALVISHDALWWCSPTTLRTRLFLLGKHVGPLGPLWLSN